jgi:aspartate carbamoyltransferase catalytic subunit
MGTRHLLTLEGVPPAEIEEILETARSMKEIMERPVRRVPTLTGVTVANLFFEPSTRTRVSFELAERRLSADVASLQTSGSSLQKGESLRDTARNVEAMKVDVVVIRHGASGAPHFLAQHIGAAVINAGDGCHEHPTQGLLDLMTLWEHFGEVEGLRVAIVGDIAHSRVARSDIWGLETLGASVVACGPATLLPHPTDALDVEVTTKLDHALEGADAVIALRIQRERQAAGLLPSLREYRAQWGLTRERLTGAKPNLVILHPGPINHGVELDHEVAEDPRAVILEQVTNGVAVRMAVLYLLTGGDGERN